MWWLVSNAWALDLSYDEALKRASEKNPTLVSAQYDLESAEGQLTAAKGEFDPLLEAGVNYLSSEYEESVDALGSVAGNNQRLFSYARVSDFFPTGTTASLGWDVQRTGGRFDLLADDAPADLLDHEFETNFNVELRQTLLQGNMAYYNLAPVRSARRFRDLQAANVAAQREQTLADTALAYWTVYYQNSVAEIAQASLAVAQEEQRVVSARVQAGDLAPVERSRVDALVVQAESALLTAQNDAAAAGDELLLAIGESPGTDVQLTTVPSVAPGVELDEDTVVSEALESSPVVQASRIDEESARLEYRDAKHARLPDLTADARYTLQGYEPSLRGSTNEALGWNLPEWYLGADLVVPLGNRADRGAVAEKGAAYGRAQNERVAVERSTDQAVRAQVRTLTSATKSVSLAEANLQFAEQTLAAQRALQNAGRAIQKDVLEAIRDVDDAKVALAKAKADAALALVELSRLKGTL